MHGSPWVLMLARGHDAAIMLAVAIAVTASDLVPPWANAADCKTLELPAPVQLAMPPSKVAVSPLTCCSGVQVGPPASPPVMPLSATLPPPCAVSVPPS